jgi:3'-5' exoribonuclease
MPRSKPSLTRVSELASGQLADFFALLSERSKRETRDGKPFYSCRFRDSRRTATFMVWADGGWFETCERDWREGQFFKIRGLYGEHDKYGPQIDIHNIRLVSETDRADGFNPADFIDRTRRDPEAMFLELRGLAEKHIADKQLQRLVVTLLDRHADALKQLPATTRHFYPYPGGLLEHTLSVTHTCLLLAEKYTADLFSSPPLGEGKGGGQTALNKDLVVAGAILHDIGRVLEFTSPEEGSGLAAQRTVPGHLVGPLFLGRDLVRDTARELGDVNPELLQLLEHLIVAHLNLLERDSPRQPMVPECLILHHADALDAYMEMYARCLAKDNEPGPFTTRDPILGRRLYKGRRA